MPTDHVSVSGSIIRADLCAKLLFGIGIVRDYPDAAERPVSPRFRDRMSDAVVGRQAFADDVWIVQIAIESSVGDARKRSALDAIDTGLPIDALAFFQLESQCKRR